MRIRLSDADRARYPGCPETLEITQDVTLREAAALQRIGWAMPSDLFKALSGAERDETGQIIRDEHSNPVRREPDFEAWLAIVWLGLRRAGVNVAYEDVDVSWDISPELDPEETEKPPAEVGEGKDSRSTPPASSTTSSPTTKRRSTTTSASSPGKSGA